MRRDSQALLAAYATRPAVGKVDTSCLDNRHWWRRIHTPASTLAPLLKDRQKTLSSAIPLNEPRGGIQDFDFARSASEPSGEKANGNPADPQRAATTLSLTKSELQSHQLSSSAHPLPPIKDDASGSSEEANAVKEPRDATGHQANATQRGALELLASREHAASNDERQDLVESISQDGSGLEEAMSASSAPFVLYQALPTSHGSIAGHDYSFSNQEEGSQGDASRQLSPSSEHAARAAARRGTGREAAGRRISTTGRAGLGEKCDQTADGGPQRGRDIAGQGRRQNAPGAGRSSAHEWADQYDFAQAQHRTGSLNQVLLTPQLPS